MYWSTGINSQLRMFQQYGGRTARNQTTFIHTLTEAKAPLQWHGLLVLQKRQALKQHHGISSETLEVFYNFINHLSHAWPLHNERRWPCWPGLRDLARLISNSFVKFSMFLYERVDWLGFRDRGFINRDLGKLAGNFAIWTWLSPGCRDESGMISVGPGGIVLHCLLYFLHQKHLI